MKKIIIILLTMVIFSAFLLTGCKKKEAVVKVDAEAPVTIEFWHAMSGTRIELIQSIVDQFMKENPNITVKVQYTGSYNDTLNKVKSAVKAGNAPQVFHSYEIGTLGLINSGIITPIDDAAKEFNLPIKWDDFFTPVQSYYKYQGKHYSMPFNSSTPLIYYNKTFLRKQDWIRKILQEHMKRSERQRLLLRNLELKLLLPGICIPGILNR